ncbi:MAG TPA: metallophosphoesterase [Opitutales bacterium]|nr:metallophosphoesterase [Opitutales bacterium]
MKTEPPARRQKIFTRRRFVQLIGGGLAGIAAGGWHSLLFAPTNPLVTEEEVWLKNLPRAFDGLRVAQLSDLHFSEIVSKEYLEKCVRLTNALEPDLILLTGDYVTALEGESRTVTTERYVEPLSEILAPLKAKLAKFAVFGNHDITVNPKAVQRAIEAAGIHFLRDEGVALRRGGERLPVVGLADFDTQVVNQKRAFSSIDPDEPTLILMHNPDLFGVGMEHKNGLIFSGHLHGGQVCFPFVGPLYIPSRFGAKYLSGRFEKGDLCMLVNRGIGVIHFRIRVNCRPEITLVTLRSA